MTDTTPLGELTVQYLHEVTSRVQLCTGPGGAPPQSRCR